MSNIAKKLITQKNISDIICEGAKEVTITPDVILTSAAKDLIRNRGIAIHYAKESKTEDLRCEIETLLKEDFGIDHGDQIKQITELVLKKI